MTYFEMVWTSKSFIGKKRPEENRVSEMEPTLVKEGLPPYFRSEIKIKILLKDLDSNHILKEETTLRSMNSCVSYQQSINRTVTDP